MTLAVFKLYHAQTTSRILYRGFTRTMSEFSSEKSTKPTIENPDSKPVAKEVVDLMAKIALAKVKEEVQEDDKTKETQKILADSSVLKKQKQRKAQTQDEFLVQKTQYALSGPHINEQGWLYNPQRLQTLDSTRKLDRLYMLHVCEKAYYDRNYKQCLAYVKRAEALYGVDLESIDDMEEKKKIFANAGRKTKKSSKVDRHVVELIHIKEKCLKKLKQTTN